MSAYSKEPPRLASVPIPGGVPAPVAAASPVRARAPLAELALVATYCRDLEVFLREEHRRTSMSLAQADEERGRHHQALLNAKLEIRRLGTALKKSAGDMHAIAERSNQAARTIEELGRREAAAQRNLVSARDELAQLRARTESERLTLEQRLRASDDERKRGTERLEKQQVELEQRLRELTASAQEKTAVADLARLELLASQNQVRELTKQLTQHSATARAHAELEGRYRKIHERCGVSERKLGDLQARYRETLERLRGAEAELASLREAHRALSASAQAAAQAALPSTLTRDNDELRRANGLLREENAALIARASELGKSRVEAREEVERLRKTIPLVDLLRLKEEELARIARELGPMLDADPRRSALCSRREVVLMQRDQLSSMLKRFTDAVGASAQPPPPPVPRCRSE